LSSRLKRLGREILFYRLQRRNQILVREIVPLCYQTHKVKKLTTMPKKTLTNQANISANRIASQNLATEMVELSDEALSQVYGGISREDGKILEHDEHFYPDPNPNREF